MGERGGSAQGRSRGERRADEGTRRGLGEKGLDGERRKSGRGCSGEAGKRMLARDGESQRTGIKNTRR